MNHRRSIQSGFPATPKRRRLGLGRFIKLSETLTEERVWSCSPIQLGTEAMDKGDSQPLPCNQIEFLCDSESNSSVCSDIPGSPGVSETSNILKSIDNWKSYIESSSNNSSGKETDLNTTNDVLNVMFKSRFDCSLVANDQNSSNCTKHVTDDIKRTFDDINQSICNNNKSVLFDTRDSFLLDIRESGIVDKSELNISKSLDKLGYNFYGLPTTAKDLFKAYRNIEKFYDWQEECLNLEAIKQRRNLIYSLPTSGGKTLVAEVLMLREVLVRKKNTLFILPFVALVQEKIFSLSPFAIQLDFLVEEYAAGKGNLPPKKRRKRNSIYVATIEKGLALIRSLLELNRLNEIGLIVVDELHLIGEPGRGGTLETLLTTVIMLTGIQIVGMSATIGNLPDLAKFLRADVFERQFRPVELTEYVKLEDVLYRIKYDNGAVEIVPDRQLAFDYSEAGRKLDPDLVAGLVGEVVPQHSCLVFCPTKRNCQSLAALLCTMQRSEMSQHRSTERAALCAALRGEGAGGELLRCARGGVAFHHAGLSADERVLLEQAYRSGVVSVLCCTSTLAAGVNLPARRVVVRAPYVGRDLITLAAYRQMAGRAGRAGVCDAGESIVICSKRDWGALRAVLCAPMPPVRSQLEGAGALLLSAVALRLAERPVALRDLLSCTLLPAALTSECIDQVCEKSVRGLLNSGALEFVGNKRVKEEDGILEKSGDWELTVSTLGNAAIKGCLDLETTRRFVSDIRSASRNLVLLGSLHLLYLVTPHDAALVTPDYRHYYSLYCSLDEEGLQTATVLGITEQNAIRMMTGKPITNVSQSVLKRFYASLIVRDLWRLVPLPQVADKYNVGRGWIQSLMTSCSSLAASGERVCEQLAEHAGEPFGSFRVLLHELAARLRHCAHPEIEALMELPAVRKARAMQLLRGGFRRVEDVARAAPRHLAGAVQHLSHAAAEHLISAARIMLIEKVENLRAEAEDVMEGLQM